MPFPLLAPAILALAPPAMPPMAPILPVQKAIDLLNAGKVGEALDQRRSCLSALIRFIFEDELAVSQG